MYLVNCHRNSIVKNYVHKGDVNGALKDQSVRVIDTSYVDEEGVEQSAQQIIADDASNADNIWFWADTTLMDAGHEDVLKYVGIPLTGGDANGGVAGYAIYSGLFGAAIGLGNIARYASGDAGGWEDEIYVDHFQPWTMYGFKRDEDGNLDMYITNAFEQLFHGFAAANDNDAWRGAAFHLMVAA